MFNTEYSAFVWTYKKYTKVMLSMKLSKLQQDQKIGNKNSE